MSFYDAEEGISENELRDRIDELLDEGFEIFDLEGDDSVYFSWPDSEDLVTVEIRPTTPREQGYSEGGPLYHVNVTSAGAEPDNKTNWFDLEQAIQFGEKQIRKILGIH